MGMMCFGQCITVSFSSFLSPLLSTIDLSHLTSLVFGFRACCGNTFGYVYRDYLGEIDMNSELVMESAILWMG